LNLCIERNKAADHELHDLEEEISEKDSLITEMKALRSDLCPCRLNLSSSGHLNAEYYSQLFGSRLPECVQGGDQFDPFVYRVISTVPYFRDCDSNDSFLAKCAELIAAIANLSEGTVRTPLPFDDEDYEMKLREEQFAFQRDFAHKSLRIKWLLSEQGRLQAALERSGSSLGQKGRLSGRRSARTESGRSRLPSPKSFLFL
jgi:hypothetical protein